MGKYSYDTRPDDTDKPGGGPPDASSIIVQTLLIPWVRKHGALPEPCPRNLSECARWWLDHMQEPEKQGETYQAASVGGGLRWECGYAVARRGALLGFLNIPQDRQRCAVVTMVTEDKIPYRGDTLRQYYDIAEETLTMRNDTETYKRTTTVRLSAAFAKMTASGGRGVSGQGPVT